MSSLRITGGEVIDVDEGVVKPRDVFIEDGRIVEHLPSPDDTMDVGGAYVAPGFIDLHTHVFSHPGFTKQRLEADRIGVRQGVACVIDAGSSGSKTIDDFPTIVHQTQKTKTFAFINIGSPGLANTEGGHASRPDLCDLPGVVEAVQRHNWIVGVKVLASSSHTGAFGLEAVKLACKAAEVTGKPLMLHVGNAPPLIDDVLDLLRPGDIVTHTFHGKVGGVLGFKDAVIEPFRQAVERGVIVDVGHGRSSFSFRVCETVLSAGMPVHTISSDLHRGNVDRFAVSLARTMTKLRMLGLPFIDVVRAVTCNPADAIGLDGFGRIRSGQPAHLTVFDEQFAPLELEDAEGTRRTAATWFDTKGVFVDGEYFERSEAL